MLYSAETASAIDPWLKKGFHELDFETYCQLDAANSHSLMDLRNRSAKFMQWRRKQPLKSDSIDFGSFVHWLVLEPGLIEQRVKLKRKVDGRTKVGKAYQADFEASLTPSDIPVDEELYEIVCGVRDDLLKNKYTSKIVGKGRKEQVGCFIHNQTQVFCKARLDIHFPEGWVVDVKTTRDASRRGWPKEVANNDYDLQAAFYCTAFEYIYKRPPQGYIFILVENTPPYDIAVRVPEPTVLEHGKYKYTSALMEYADCLKANHWPGYPEAAEPFELPGWAVYQEQT